MAEIGIPEKRRIVIPQTIPAEPAPHVKPPQKDPVKTPAEPVKEPA